MLPFFYHPSIQANQKMLTLDEPTSKHVVQVLRMQEGEQLMVTDGKGLKVIGTIVAAERKRCGVRIDTIEKIAERPFKFTLAISFTKNNSRNEWLLEKATEMGIDHIYPLVTARTEKEKFNEERLNGILVSAMLQSQQCYMPELMKPAALKDLFFESVQDNGQQLIAHCIESSERTSLLTAMRPEIDTVILIGPEGDFTPQEIDLCIAKGFHPVTLGSNRLRTETAGLYVCTVFNALNYA